MAANRSIRQIFYAPTMRSFSKNLCINHRNMATMTSSNHLSKTSVVGVWNHDPSFPLPGNVGVDIKSMEEKVNNSTPKETVASPPPYQSLAAAFFDLEDEDMRKNRILNQFVGEKMEEDDASAYVSNEVSSSETSTTTTMSFLHDLKNVECRIQSCPESLVKGFKGLFADLPLTGDSQTDSFTVITLSQKTENDMTSWSDQVEQERETLTGVFIDNAKEICGKIQGNGYWADFIEPASGHAFYSSHRNETLFETDDRLNQIGGFSVEDLGCCKVLMHKEWKSNVFVGLIFTNAPVESHFFEAL